MVSETLNNARLNLANLSSLHQTAHRRCIEIAWNLINEDKEIFAFF